MLKSKKIMITGGHISPVLALIESLIGVGLPLENLVVVGRKYALDQEKTVSLEYKELANRNIKFIPLEAGRLTRVITRHSLLNFLKLPQGFIRAWQVVRKERPDIVFCFGGYIALPVAIAAFLNRIKICTHEQTLSPGLANRIIARLADKVLCAFAEASRYLPKEKTIVCGNLVRSAIFSIQKKPFSIIKDKPVIYITGGSLGSHSINSLIKEILPQLLKKYIVIHQTGETKEYQDYEKLMSWQKKLPDEQRNRYFMVKHFFEEEIGYVYSLADLVIGRAGANTFFELLALEKPTIFIPLPWSAHHEQQKQADIFQKFSVGTVFNQSDSSDNLFRLIEKMMIDLPSYKNNFKNLKFLYRQDVTSVVLSTLEKI